MSKLLRAQAAYLRDENRRYTAELVPLEVPRCGVGPGPIAAWRSNRFLVQLFNECGAQRITINRTMVDEVKGGWLQGITWDEIQTIKRQIGFAERFAVELYPADSELVNVANMRHIWLVDAPAFAWRRAPAMPSPIVDSAQATLVEVASAQALGLSGIEGVHP